MKKNAICALGVYIVSLLLASFLNFDKVAPWILGRAEADDLRTQQAVAGVEEARAALGVTRAVDAFDCATAPVFNDLYKDNSKCFDDEYFQQTGRRENTPPNLNQWLSRVTADMDHATRQAFVRAFAAYLAGKLGHTPLIAPADYTEQAPKNLAMHTGAKELDAQIGLDKALEPSKDAKDVPSLEAELTPAEPQKINPKSVLVLGDSLALGLAKSIQRALSPYKGIAFARAGKVSSGLSSPHLYDWDKKVVILLKKYKPDILIIMMGINDANNNIRVGEVQATLGTAAWPNAYEHRVKSFLHIIEGFETPVYWVGLPVVRDEAMTARIDLTNGAAKNACESVDICHFVDIKEVLTDEEGNYTNYKKDKEGYSIRIRSKDGIHFSTEGGDLLSRHILDFMSQNVEFKTVEPKDTSI